MQPNNQLEIGMNSITEVVYVNIATVNNLLIDEFDVDNNCAKLPNKITQLPVNIL